MNLIIFLLSAFVLSPGNIQSDKDYIILTGTVADATSKEFKLLKRERGAANQIDIELLDDGSFVSDTIRFGTGRYAFHNGSNVAELYLTNGGTYHFTGVSRDFRNTAKLTGTNPDTSNYLLTKIANIIKLRGDSKAFYKLDEKEFVGKQKTLNEQYVSYLESFPNIEKAFKEAERKELHYSNILYLKRYESVHRMLTKNPDFKISDDLKTQLDEIDLYNIEEYRANGSYKKMVDEHYRMIVYSLTQKEDVDKYLVKLEVLGAIPSDDMKNILLLSAATSEIKRATDMDEYYKAFLAVSTSPKNNKTITTIYDSLNDLGKGKASPVFTDFVNHAGGTNSLSDFKGKYVYIDLWATWCGPCLKEVPALKEVEKQYHNSNITFLGISIDVEKAHDKWRAMVTDKELAGVQLLADKAFQSTFIKDYQVSGIPRFILIDPEGNIVSANAPRPSAPELIKLFNDLNI